MHQINIFIIKCEYKLEKLKEFIKLYLEWCKTFDKEFKREINNLQ